MNKNIPSAIFAVVSMCYGFYLMFADDYNTGIQILLLGMILSNTIIVKDVVE